MSEGDVKPCPPLVMGEIAWECRFVAVGERGEVKGRVAVTPEMRQVLSRHARRLYLELVDRDGYSTWLIHRAGWPFDLKLPKARHDVIGFLALDLRPTGAGDEVMRDLIDSFESDCPGFSVYLTNEQRG